MLFSGSSDQAGSHVVIAGGGVAALEAMIALHETAAGRLRVTVISDADTFTYRPLLVGEPFGFGQPARYPLDRLCNDNAAELVHGQVAAVHADEHEVELADGARVGYDFLIVAVGARTAPAFEYGVSFDRERSPEEFAGVLADVRDGFAPRIAIVVPRGVSWTLPAYELALMTAARGSGRTGEGPSVTVVTHEPRPLCAFGSGVDAEVDRVLAAAGVTARCGAHTDMVSDAALRADGEWVEADRIVSLPHVTGPHLPGLPCDVSGFVSVDDFGRVPGVDDVYAAGDGTTVAMKQGGVAAQLADVITRHIVTRLSGENAPIEPFHPILRGLLRTPEGPRYLRAELDDVEGTSTISDEPLWWPPSKISSRWLAPYLARIESARQRGERAGASADRATG